MRRVAWQDPDGRKFMCELPDGADDADAPRGVPVGPPELDPLGLPLEVEVRLNNELFNRGLLTADDVRRRSGEVLAALQAALRSSAQKVLALYEGEGYPPTEGAPRG